LDTKWKNRKKAVSFILFFAGATLTLGSVVNMWRNKPGGTRIPQMFEQDYQKSREFRSYMATRLDNFLIMASGGSGLRDFYYDNGYIYDGTAAYAEDTLETQEEVSVEWGNEAEAVEEYAGGSYREYGNWNDAASSWLSGGDSLTEEERKELARRYHDRIKGDKNLLYTVSYDGEVLYSNADLKPGGEDSLPEGYNFFLEFDGEKVRIVKDGKELDVYGDGYYRDDSQWYVPGYKNFQGDDRVKKAVVCMAAAGNPAMYTKGDYGTSGSWQPDNELYWMQCNFLGSRALLIKNAVFLAVGLVLLVLAFFTRQTRREAEKELAVFQSKIWVEFKVLFFIILLGILVNILAYCSRNYGIWQEFREITMESWDYAYVSERALALGNVIMGEVPAWFVILLFWGVFFFWNDLHYNRKITKYGLIYKLCRTYSAKDFTLPLSLKIAKRNRGVFLTAILYCLFLIGMVMIGRALEYRNAWGMVFLLLFLGTLCFLVLLYFFGKKNMETARDLDTLSRCVGEIRDGNYMDMGEEFAGHDLENVMGQLEDIRHGMARAVEEQMKSQRMKVELIANVSHDIKTPLTSIISYVEFLKQEEDLPAHVKDYVRILDEKSQRLKNMVMDVFAVSKAASGELPVNMEELDFGKLLRQTMADMEEEIDKSPVTFRTEIPGEPVKIMADGQRLYRVFQNLFQNAIKYSLQGSRVYVSLRLEDNTAVCSVKNTSQMEIKKDKDFTERFVRGDESRTDGGSGLGLSIAQSFTEACGGEFSWEVDADLFVVKVSFQKI